MALAQIAAPSRLLHRLSSSKSPHEPPGSRVAASPALTPRSVSRPPQSGRSITTRATKTRSSWIFPMQWREEPHHYGRPSKKFQRNDARTAALQLQTVAHAFAEASNTGLGQHGPPPPHAPPCASSSRQSAQRPDTSRIRARQASKDVATSALHAGSSFEQMDVQMG